MMTGSENAAKKLARNALVVRAVAAIVIHSFATPYLFAPDEETYSFGGAAIARYWRGEVAAGPGFMGAEGLGYYYIVAALYLPFGELPLLPKLLNAWIGSLAVLELFRLTRLIGGSDAAALRAAKFMAFFPSIVLWSSLMIRDVWVQWLLVRMAREMAELKGRLILSRIISVGVLIWALTQFRSYLLYAAVGPFVLSFFLGKSRDILRNTLLGSVLALALVYLGARSDDGSAGKVQTLDLVELQRLRTWSSSAVAADSGFAADADVSTVGGALSVLPVGLAYFFFAPFPWQLGSLRQALAIPETLFFYTLVPGIIAGVFYLFRQRLIDSIGVLLVTMTVTFGYAIGQGNVGTLYRHKAQVTGFYYAFAAIGMEYRRRRTTQYPRYFIPSAQELRPNPLTDPSVSRR